MSRQKQLIPMGTGERLKHRREELRRPLEDVAAELHIDVAVMRALEEDQLGHMAPLYRRGYIRSYAQLLDFDAGEIQEMLEQVGNEQPELHTVFPEAGNPRQAERWIKATSYVLASLLVGTLAWQFTYEAVRLSQDRGDPELNVDARQPAVQGTGAQQPARSAGHVNASIAALEKLPRQRTPAAGGAGTQAWSAIQDAASLEATGTSVELAEDSLLELSASGDSWVEITDASGAQLELDLVRGGTSKQYRGTAPFRIQLGRASAVKLLHNGAAIDIAPFTRGGVTQMTLHADGTGEAVGAVQPPGS